MVSYLCALNTRVCLLFECWKEKKLSQRQFYIHKKLYLICIVFKIVLEYLSTNGKWATLRVVKRSSMQCDGCGNGCARIVTGSIVSPTPSPLSPISSFPSWPATATPPSLVTPPPHLHPSHVRLNSDHGRGHDVLSCPSSSTSFALHQNLHSKLCSDIPSHNIWLSYTLCILQIHEGRLPTDRRTLNEHGS